VEVYLFPQRMADFSEFPFFGWTTAATFFGFTHSEATMKMYQASHASLRAQRYFEKTTQRSLSFSGFSWQDPMGNSEPSQRLNSQVSGKTQASTVFPVLRPKGQKRLLPSGFFFPSVHPFFFCQPTGVNGMFPNPT